MIPKRFSGKLSTITAVGLLVAFSAFSATPGFAGQATNSDYQWQKIVSGLKRPTSIVQPPDGSGRLFVTEQPGTVRVIQDGKLLATPFLNVTSKLTSAGNEQGLLDIAFHPDYAKNGTFFITYTRTDGQPTLARYQVSSSDPNIADPSSAKVLISIPHPFPNHNGSQITFGPDGYLYYGMGDGGSGGDPFNNGQNKQALLGSMMRLDVNQGNSYGIPADNPFVNDKSARPELWAKGLRNPWRFSFDMKTHELYIADVGQNQYEEIDVQPADSKGGENYGWSVYEANHDFKGGGDKSKFVFPVTEYDHSEGRCSVTGGYVYRGKALPKLDGVYLYADYCSGTIWTLQKDSSDQWNSQAFMATSYNITSFGQDTDGEIYLADQKSGTIFKLVAAQ